MYRFVWVCVCKEYLILMKSILWLTGWIKRRRKREKERKKNCFSTSDWSSVSSVRRFYIFILTQFNVFFCFSWRLDFARICFVCTHIWRILCDEWDHGEEWGKWYNTIGYPFKMWRYRHEHFEKKVSVGEKLEIVIYMTVCLLCIRSLCKILFHS